MSCVELLLELRNRGARVWLEDERLRVAAPHGVLSDEIRHELKQHRSELIEWFKRQSATPRPALRRYERVGRQRLSYAQQRLWFLYRMEGASATYNIPLALRLNGELDEGALEAALNDVVERHEALRTVFPEEEGVPYQKVLSGKAARVQLRVESVDESDLSGKLGAAGVEMELERELPLQAWLFEIDEKEHVLLLVLHHIAGDGWSLGPLARDLGEAYGARREGRAPEFVPLSVQYADYTEWQREVLGEEEDKDSVMSQQLEYWKKVLEGMAEEIDLPVDRARPQAMTYRGGTVELKLDAELHRGLKRLAGETGASLFMVLQAGLAVLLRKLGAGEDIGIGTVVAGRSERELEELVGFFVNTLVLRTDVSGDPSFVEVIERVRKFDLEAYGKEEVPFERLVEALQPVRSQARHPLVQVMLVLQNAPEARLKLPGIVMSEQVLPDTVAKFDLTFSLTEEASEEGEAEGLSGYVEYSAELFDRATVEELAQKLKRLLRQAVTRPRARLHELKVVSEEEQQRLLNEFNARVEEPIKAKTLVELFEAAVERRGEAEALSFNEERVSYAELNRQANRLAHYLVGRGFGRESLVGIVLERAVEMVVAMVAVVKAGGGYVPVDPEYPRARVEAMLKDAAPKMVITTRKHASGLETSGSVAVICLDEEQVGDKLSGMSDENPKQEVLPEQAAYVIYTSGSTGTPKGVVVTHGNVGRLLGATEQWFRFGAEDVWTLFHSYGFDFSVWEIWGALVYGGRLVVVPKEVARGPGEFLRLLVEEGVTVLNQTPSAFYQLMEAEEEEPGLGKRLRLRVVVFGGEALELRRLRSWYERHGESDRELVNMYGITETTVHVSYARLTQEMVQGGAGSVIGGNIPDLRVYVLDEYLEPVGRGVVGELYVGGAGVARGYLKRAGLSAERFIADPYAEEPGARMYRTGDLGRWKTEGVLEYRERADQQVKVRGFRIELGEIEEALKAEAGVGQAAVIAVEDGRGGKQLVGYVAGKGGVELDGIALRKQLQQRLPEHMVPAVVMVMDGLPLTKNGKLDRKALPLPEFASQAEYLAPRTAEEEVLCAVYADVLGVERVGIRDSFFELGGHSLLAARLVSRVRAALEKELSIRTLFEAPTIAELVERLEEDDRPRPALRKYERGGRPRLSYAQQRLWFLYRMEGASATYNIPLALRLTGELYEAALEAALNDVVERHEALRTVFPEEEGVPYQKVLSGEATKVKLRVERVGESELSGRLAEAAGVEMDLERDLPLKAWLFEINATEHVLLLVLHHIAGDGWSLAPLARDLGEAYGARREGRAPEFVALSVQYVDYTEWQREVLGEEEDAESLMSQQLEYWRTALEGMPEEIELPVDQARPRAMSYRGGTVELKLDAELHRGLKRLAVETGASLFMVLQAGLAVLLKKLGAGEDIGIGTVVAGRSERELEELVGFFVNTLVLRTDVSGDPSFVELIEQVRKFDLEAYGKEELPFERLVEALQPVRAQTRHPLVQVMLTLQNTPHAVLSFAGLSIRTESFELNSAKFDLGIALEEILSANGNPLGLEGDIEFNEDIFNKATISSIASRLVGLLTQAANAPHKPLHELEIISAAEKHFLIEGCNQTSELGLNTNIVEMFERQAVQVPAATAVVQSETALTYHELNLQANRLAHYLVQLKVRPESFVGIALDRSPQMVVAILAVWKAGAAYVPFDPEYPQTRLEYMLSETLPEIVLSANDLIPRIPKSQRIQFVDLDSEQVRNKLDQQPESNPQGRLLPGNAAYVIYTSGSTGNPKGVVVSHAGIPSLARTHVSRLNIDEHSRVLQFASLNFDQSFWEVLMALTSGAALVLPEAERSGVPLQELITQQNVTHATLTPSVLATIQDSHSAPENLIVVGEKCPPELVARWAPLCRMVNAYGPTESTVCAAISLPISGSVSPPIGFPVVNTRLYVLDDYLQPVPVGVPGELYIAGVGLARGYLKQPGLTSRRFVADPYGSAPGSRMYRTGDLVRRQADGALEFIGRTDDQVKVRGFRIELGEIEAALRSFPGVADCAVVIRESRLGKEIVAYVVSSDHSNLDRDGARRYLRAQLPGHMIPSEIVQLEQLPLTHSGKVDRKGLSNRQSDLQQSRAVVLPRTKYERLLADVWKQVLGREAVGVDDNFFDVGGHSLLLAQVHARLLKVLDKPLPMVKLFEHPTISLLASYLEGLDAASATLGTPESIFLNSRKSRDIAIIGMACRFPGASSIEQFWQNLSHGIDSITELPQAELSALPQQLVDDPEFVYAGGYLDNIELFDAAFFGLNPAEATAMDPQQRLLLECAWETMESAGYVPRGQRIGLFAGAGESHYRDLLRSDASLTRTLGELQVTIATGKDHIAPRLSYLLDLRGPSVPVNTACSTSLVAVHMACQSLVNGECEMALAGGVSLAPRSGYLFEENSILSPDGRCKAFDAGARGTVPGSGAGLVLLKPLDAALADGDHIHAVIKGSAINNDGTVKVGYTAPSVEGQRRVIADALSRAGVGPHQVSYIETHGTGTSLGDPIEIEALRQALANSGPAGSFEKSCAIGSIKTNIGHCDSAAGIAGLIKTVLCLKNRTLVPSLHFEKPNPQLDLENSPFYVNTQTRPWEADHRFAGVSSFGIGGTNAHLILEEAPAASSSPSNRPWQLLTLSARTEAALERRKKELVEILSSNPRISLADAAFTSNAGRETFAVRQSFVCSSNEEAIAALTNNKERHSHTNAREHSIVFLFPGQGKAYADLGADLYSNEAVFRDTVDHCSQILLPLIGTDLRQLMFSREGKLDSQIYRPLFWQPALFVIDFALAQLWMSWGIRPAAMIGHSLGEYVAATIAGVLSVEDALKLVVERASGTEKLEPGAMLAVPVSEAQILPYIKDRVALAAVNGPELCVLAGPVDEIDALQREIHSLNPIRLEASHAFHSVLVDPIMEPLARAAAAVKLSSPKIPYLSNVTGTWMTEDDATDPNYWARHLRSTVRFEDAVNAALTLENAVLLEIGPGKVLTDLVRRTHSQATVISSLGSDPAGKALTQALGNLWCEGIKVDWKKYYNDENRQRVPLPTYPFERQRYWVEAAATALPISAEDPLATRDPFEKWFYSTNWKRTNHLPEWNPQGERKKWLVFSEEQGIGKQVAEKLRERNCVVHEVRRGNVFHRNGTGHATVNPSDAEDFQRLVESFSNGLPEQIVWAWISKGNSQDGTNSCFDGLIYLAQVLASSTKTSTVRLGLISSGMYRVLDEPLSQDEDAATLALVHILPKEMPFIKCQNIDLAPEHRPNDDRAAEWVLSELATEIAEPVVAYRSGRRWLPFTEQIAASENVQAPLKRNGVYVITHALQEIGFVLAEYLTQNLGYRVAMLDRSFFPRRHEWEQWVQTEGEADPVSRNIIRLRSMSDAVNIFSANLSDGGQMARVKRQIEADLGEIRGVFHLDRAAKTGLIVGKTDAPAAAVRNDLAELSTLDTAFHNELLVLFSSDLAECGGIGQVDQAARSAIVGHFAERRSTAGKPTLAVELGTRAWSGTEAENPDAGSFLSQQLEEKRQRFGMSPGECVQAIMRSLTLGLSNVIVSTRDFNALMSQQHLFTADFFQEQMEKANENNDAHMQVGHGRPDVSSAYVPPRNEVEKLLVQIWKDTFRFDEIGVEDNFFELGGHSLMAVQLLKGVNQTFSTKTALKDLFEGPTIAQLSAKISGTHAQDGDASELEALLAEIESMSEDELRAELDGKTQGNRSEGA